MRRACTILVLLTLCVLRQGEVSDTQLAMADEKAAKQKSHEHDDSSRCQSSLLPASWMEGDQGVGGGGEGSTTALARSSKCACALRP